MPLQCKEKALPNATMCTPEEKEDDDHLVEQLAERRSERQAGPGTLRGRGQEAAWHPL